MKETEKDQEVQRRKESEAVTEKAADDSQLNIIFQIYSD
jgi:hypothetical protein